MRISTKATCIAGMSLLYLTNGHATEPLILEEILVTAQKRTESLQDVPVSVNTVSGLKIADTGISNLEDMTTLVPNLTMNQTGIGTVVAIRGIGSGINQGFEQSVGQYIDGIYYGRAQLARAPFLDLAQVEVLRGPQGILFGKNSIAGAISMQTAKPTDSFEGSLTALYEPNHGETDLRLVVSGPLNDDISGRLAILDRSIDGYYTNTALNRTESDETIKAYRGSIYWTPNNNLSLLLKAETATFDVKGRFLEAVNAVELPGGTPYASVLSLLTGGAYTLETQQNFTRSANGDSSDNNTDNITLNLEYAFGEHTLNWISGYNAYDYLELCDCDFTGAPIFNGYLTEDFDQLSQEIRLTSPVDQTISYILGGFYQTSDLAFSDSVDIPTDSILPLALNNLVGPTLASLTPGAATRRNFTQDNDVWALFAQATWNINNAWRLTLGGRYTSERKSATREQFHITPTGTRLPEGAPSDPYNIIFGLFYFEPYDLISAKRSEESFTPVITLQHDLSPDTMLYATYTTGFKAGGFDARSNANPDPLVVNALRAGVLDIIGVFEYDDEKTKSVELGGKFTFADGAAELNAAIYRMEFDNLQTSQFDGVLGFNVTNAGKATSQGLELDARWALTSHTTLSGSLAYLDFAYDQFPNAQCYFGETPNSSAYPGLCDRAGQRREFTPEYQAAVSLNYQRPITSALELRALLDLTYSDDYFSSPTNDPNLLQDSYTKVNLRLGLGAVDGRWEVALVGKNLTDESVASFGNQLPVSTTLTGGSGTAYYAFYDRPRSVALQASMQF